MDQIKIKIGDRSLSVDFYKAVTETKKIAILLPGLPYKPKKYNLVDKLNDLGFDVAFLRYSGTWGSEGEFLEQPPQKDVNILIKKIRDEGLNSILYKEVCLIGSSFGGAVSLTVNDDPIIKKIIVLSPVISYKKVPAIDTLSEYLISNFPNEYVFRQERFTDLINDNISSPVNQYEIDSSKVLLIGGREDEEINITDIVEFGNQNNIRHIVFDGGHITFSKITDDIFVIIKDFLN